MNRRERMIFALLWVGLAGAYFSVAASFLLSRETVGDLAGGITMAACGIGCLTLAAVNREL